MTAVKGVRLYHVSRHNCLWEVGYEMRADTHLNYLINTKPGSILRLFTYDKRRQSTGDSHQQTHTAQCVLRMRNLADK